MKRIFDDNKTTATSNQMNLKECYTLVCKQKANLSFEELLFVLSEMQEELSQRTTVIREIIPSEVWMNIFKLLSEKEDLSFIMSLKSVCKHWKNVFSECHLTVATIYKDASLDWMSFAPNIQYLTIKDTECHIPIDFFEKYWTNLISFQLCIANVKIVNDNELDEDAIYSRLSKLQSLEISKISQLTQVKTDANMCLTKFSNLQHLKITKVYQNIPQFFDVIRSLANLKKIDICKVTLINEEEDTAIIRFLEEDLIRFEVIFFPLLNIYNCYKIQQKYPHIRFRWYNDYHAEHKKFDTYEGEFSNDYDTKRKNRYHGKGVYIYDGGGTYEGEFKNSKREGYGRYVFVHGGIYNGDWKNNLKEGYGIYLETDGSKYIGNWKEGEKGGQGIEYFSNGDKFEGEWEKGEMRVGVYRFYYSGNRYEGGWKNGVKEGSGTYFYSGNDEYRFEGNWAKGKKNGFGIEYYSNGDRYEANWLDNVVKSGIFYFADGSQKEVNDININISEI